MAWIEEDSIEYDGFDTITLFRDSENEYMKMTIKISLDELHAIVKGEYIELNVEDNKERYFAYSVSREAGITPYKIYTQRNR